MKRRDAHLDNVIYVDFARRHGAPLCPRRGEKSAFFGHYVETGITLVGLDASRQGVRVPWIHTGNPMLYLNFSHRFQIPDFEFDIRGCRATLTFSGTPYYVAVPWSAVFMLRHQPTLDLVLWPEDAPEEVLDPIVPLDEREQFMRENRRIRSAMLDALPPQGDLA